MFDELRSNARLRAGLAVVAALVAIALLLDAQAALRARSVQVAGEQARLLAVEQGAAEQVWLERAEQAAQARAGIEARLWRAPSAGAAEAAFVDWVNRELAAAQATVTNVVSATVPASGAAAGAAAPLPDGLHLLRLNVAFAFAPGALERVLERLLAEDRLVVVESLSVRQRPVPRVQLVLTSVAQIGEARAGAKP